MSTALAPRPYLASAGAGRTATPAASAAPTAPRPVLFDPFVHASFFRVDDLTITASKNGYPQMRLEANTPQGVVRAGSVTLIPERPATMAGPSLPETIIVNGRMADFTPDHRAAMERVGARFKAESGDASRSSTGKPKTFWTIFIATSCTPAVIKTMAALQTRNGKPDATAGFTSRAIQLFNDRVAALRAEGAPF